MNLLTGSPQQESIWRFILDGSAHGCIDAVAGSGKTTTIVEAVKRVPRDRSILLLAFNSHIAKELTAKLSGCGLDNVTVLTTNAFGWRILRSHFRGCELDQYKMDSVVEDVIPKQSIHTIGYGCGKIASYLKQNLDDPTPDAIAAVMDQYEVDLSPFHMPKVCEYVPQLLEKVKLWTHVADFDDQVYLPVSLGLPVPQFDLVFVDEAQDTNVMGQTLAFRAVEAGGRLIIVGDKHQAIYGFRGADFFAIDRMRETLESTALGCERLPLTVSRRCPKRHIKLAKMKVPHIEAMEDAPDGTVDNVPPEKLEELLDPGDLVLSRVNAPLLPLCYRLLRSGRKARIRGRDEGARLRGLVKKLGGSTIPELMNRLKDYEANESAKLIPLGKKAANRLAALHEKCDCLIELAMEVKSIDDLNKSLTTLFADDDPNNMSITLGTIHRTKGLESKRVFIVNPYLIPHPMAKTDEARMQEDNLAYVACTRSLYKPGNDKSGYLAFVGDTPPALGGNPIQWKPRFEDKEAA